MKKIFLSLIVIGVLIVSGCATSSVSEEKTTESASGAAKTAEKGTEKAAAAKSEKPEAEKTAYTETIKVPRLVKETSYYSDGYVESYRVFTLDDNGETIREDLFDSFDDIIESVVLDKISVTEVHRSLFNARGELQSWTKISNNTDGTVKRTESYNSGDVLQTASNYSYDSNGNKTGWSVTDGNNIVLSETKYTYQSGMNTRIDIYDSSMTMKEYFEIVYDGDKPVKNNHFDDKGQLKVSIEYTYTDGVLTEEKHLRANGSVLRVVKYENDESGNPVKTMFFDGNGKLKDWNEKEYEYITEEITVWK